MVISYIGHSCFKITSKYNGRDLILVTDPFGKSIGLRLPKLSADIVTVSHDHDDHNNAQAVQGNLEKQPFIIDQVGEYEIKNVFVAALKTWHDSKEGKDRGENLIVKFDIEGLSLAHLGDLGHVLNDEQLEKLGNIDILIVPVGGTYTLNAVSAAKVVRQIEPRIVIPMHYRDPKVKIKLDSVNAFRKEMGGQAETVKKLKIAKKNLPADEIKLIIIEK